MQKRQYSSGYHIDWISKSPKKVKRSEHAVSPIKSKKLIESNYFDQSEPSLLTASDEIIPVVTKSRFSQIIENIQTGKLGLNPDSCDRMISRDGDIVLGKILEIGLESIKYKRCDHINGPILNIEKNSILLIEYSDGKRTVFKEEKPKANNSDYYRSTDSSRPENERKGRKLEGFGFAGFLLTLTSIPIWVLVSWFTGFVAGILGVIFGAIGIHRCRKNPDTKMGKGFAITSLIVGMLLITLSLVFVLILL
jgi:hypothetical protein